MKIYRDVDGSFAFKDASLEEVKKVFGNFKFDDAKFEFTENVLVCNKESGCAGFKISGKINNKFDNDQVIRLFAKLMKKTEDEIIFEIK